MGTEDLMIRLATHDDRDTVLGIDDVYDGGDYLAGQYSNFIEDQLRRNYILEKDGLAIAYICATLIDDCQGVIYQAARTRPVHRQLGYQTYLKKEVTKLLIRQYPTLKEVLFRSRSLTTDSTYLFEMKGGRKVLFPTVFRYTNLLSEEAVTSTRAALEANKALLNGVQHKDIRELPDVAKREEFKSLITEDRFTVALVPLSIDRNSNFELKNRFPDKFAQTWDGDVLTGISFVTRSPDPHRHRERVDFDIYPNSVETIEKHIASGLSEVLESKLQTSTHFMVHLPQCFDGLDFDKLCREKFSLYGWERPKHFQACHYVCLVWESEYLENIKTEMEKQE